MALPTSGPLSLNAIHVEAGGTSGTQASINDADIRGLIGKASGAQMSFSEWYGASASFPFTAEFLVLAGGGGGGQQQSGAGGGGGYRSSVSGEPTGAGQSTEPVLSLVTGTAYTITVGAGGAGGSGTVQPLTTGLPASQGANGGNSVFATITASGGGGGGVGGKRAYTPPPNLEDGLPGGCGGGGGIDDGSTAPGARGFGTASQGKNGGFGASNAFNFRTGGGGGGSRADGQNALNYKGGDGGAGTTSAVTGSSVARGGGGGGGSDAGPVGGAGNDGGANGSRLNYTPAPSAVANRGGGGGGAGTGSFGGNGGSGLVVIRVANTISASFSPGVSYTTWPSPGKTAYIVTAAGGSDTVTFS